METEGRVKGALASLEKKLFYRLTHKNEVATIRRYTGLSSGKLLDVGCGPGDRLSRLAEAGFSVRGMEIQPELVEYVRERLGFEADTGTLDSVAYPPESFDIVTSHWVLEHLLDVRAALEKVHDMLKPNGWFVAEVPLADSLQVSMLGRRWSQFSEAPRHMAIPSQEGVRRAFTASGFCDIKFVPSSILDCSGIFGLSVIPSASTTHTYKSSSLLAHAPRIAGGLLVALHVPLAAVENHLLHRPAGSLVFARKRPGSG
jgi:SAM-dependent methyltransferase